MPVELQSTNQSGQVVPVRFIRSILITKGSLNAVPNSLSTFAKVPTINGVEVGAPEPDGAVELSLEEAMQWPETAPFMERLKRELYVRRTVQG